MEKYHTIMSFEGFCGVQYVVGKLTLGEFKGLYFLRNKETNYGISNYSLECILEFIEDFKRPFGF